MTEYKTFWEAAPFIGGGALLLGGGARITKGLFDLARRADPESSTENIEPTEEPIVEVPVPVSSEEAAELRRKGVQVKRADVLQRFDMGPVGAFGLGALGTAGVMGGWSIADKIIDNYRKKRAESKRDAIKNRIQKLMNDEPAPEDLELHANMKAAECMFFDKKAGLSLEHHVVNPLAALLGGGMLLAGVRAYNQASVSGDESAKVKALKAYLKKKKTTAPLISTVPVEVAESAGSPAQQAAANAAL
jgi:hypothetical protein